VKNREKIIVVMALTVVIYGLLDYFILSKKDAGQKSGRQMAEAGRAAEDFSSTSMDKITRIELQMKPGTWQSLISKIESDWKDDPFLQPLKQEAGPDEEAPPLDVTGITYSGFMTVGKMSFAIINGLEYKPGETIIEYEYEIMEITTQKVVLKKDNQQAVIFLKED
jgi:hypothetical protein